MEENMIALNQEEAKTQQAPETMEVQTVQPIGAEQVKQFTEVLMKYHAGLKKTKDRIIASENWWKLRNSMEEEKSSAIGKDGGFVSRSGWLHNVIVSKHADAIEAYPEPNILPREVGDRPDRTALSGPTPTPCGRSARPAPGPTRWFGTAESSMDWGISALKSAIC